MSKRQSSCRMYSCITASTVTAVDLDIDYWGSNIESPVLFDEALQCLLHNELSVDLLIEIGPHAALKGPVRQTLTKSGKQDGTSYLPSLIRGNNPLNDILNLAGQLWLRGYPIDINDVNASLLPTNHPKPKFIVDMPGYPWTYDEMHWTETRVSREWLWRKHPRHDLLGSREPASTPFTVIRRNVLRLDELPWLRDHKIGESVLFPGSGFVCMALEAGRQLVDEEGKGEWGSGKWVVEEVEIVKAMRLEEKKGVEIVTELRIYDEEADGSKQGRMRWKVMSVTLDGVWTEHAKGFVMYDQDETAARSARSPFRKTRRIKSRQLYNSFKKLGLNYGPCFQTLGDVCRTLEGRAEATISVNPSKNQMTQESEYLVHPATIDGCFQLAFAATLNDHDITKRSYLPSSIKRMAFFAPSAALSEAALESDATVEGGARVCGLKTVEADFQLRCGENLVIDAEVGFIAVEGLTGVDEENIMPEPYGKLCWMPDVDLLEGDTDLEQLLGSGNDTKEGLDIPNIKQELNGPGTETKRKSSTSSLERIIQLLTFKRPGATILEIGGDAANIAAILKGAGGDLRYPSAKSVRSIDGKGTARDMLDLLRKDRNALLRRADLFAPDHSGEDFEPGSVDIVVIRRSFDSDTPAYGTELVNEVLSADGHVILLDDKQGDRLSDLDDDKFTAVGRRKRFWTKDRAILLQRQPLLAANGISDSTEPVLYILYTDNCKQVATGMKAMADDMGFPVKMLHADKVTKLPKESKVVSLLELREPLLSDMDGGAIEMLKLLFKRAASLHWVTSAGNPRMVLMQGMAKCLQAEYPGLELTCVKTEQESCNMEEAMRLILCLACKWNHDNFNNETSILLKHDKVWISRYVLDEERNHNDLSLSKGIVQPGRFEGRLQLDMRKIGQLESFFFKERFLPDALEPGLVRVRPTAFVLNKEGGITLKGLNSEQFFSHDCIGRVVEAAPGSSLGVNTKIFCSAGSLIESEMIVPETTCWNCAERDQVIRIFGPGMRASDVKTFDLSELPAAVEAVTEADNHASVILENRADTLVPVHRVKSSRGRFRQDGTYLMVGCLGGLGRSITFWMLEHGARNFILLSRSGRSSPEAADFLRELQQHRDVVVKVVKGDVSCRKDVRKAVEGCHSPIRGVIQASTVYDETRFEQMTAQTWQRMLMPKVKGTANIHFETREQPLDFFVMTSSSIGITGATTQTHYAAANSYLDAMADFRRDQGLPATSISLGMVTGIGRFEKNESLIKVLQQRGAYGIDEPQFWRMMEEACFGGGGLSSSHRDTSTLVTALDPTQLLLMRNLPEWMTNDPCLSHIGHAVKQLQPDRPETNSNDSSALAILQTLTSQDWDKLKTGPLVQQALLEKLSSLVLTSVEKLKDSLQRPLSDLGLDSIVGTELQGWFWRELRVKLDFMDLFASQRSLRGLVDLLTDKLEGLQAGC